MNLPMDFNYDRLNCNVSEYLSRRIVPCSTLEDLTNAEITTLRDDIMGTLVAELRVRLLSNRLEEPPVVETTSTEKSLEVIGYYRRPATWWDHLKDTFKKYMHSKWGMSLSLKIGTDMLERTKETVEVTNTCLKQTVHVYNCPHLEIDKGARHVEFLIGFNTEPVSEFNKLDRSERNVSR